MSKDRSTAGSTIGTGGFQAGGRGAATRLPSAPRERKPALAALAVLLIVGGALATMLLVTRSGNRSDVLEIARDVAPGTAITANDLTIASVASDNAIHYFKASQESDVVGRAPQVTLVHGSLLVLEMLQTQQSEMPKAGEEAITLVLKPGQFPQGRIDHNDVLNAYVTAKADAGGTTPANSPKIGSVRALTWSGSDDNFVLTVAVPEGLVSQIESAGSNLVLGKPGS